MLIETSLKYKYFEQMVNPAINDEKRWIFMHICLKPNDNI